MPQLVHEKRLEINCNFSLGADCIEHFIFNHTSGDCHKPIQMPNCMCIEANLPTQGCSYRSKITTSQIVGLSSQQNLLKSYSLQNMVFCEFS